MPHATQVVDRVTTTDRVTGRVLEVSYQYAHGVYHGQERESADSRAWRSSIARRLAHR